MHFLKCDAPGCDHRQDVDDFSEDMIGLPCPKCGASLLTREDYEYTRDVLKPALETLKALGLAKDPPVGGSGNASFNFHAGVLTTEVKVPAKENER